MSLLPAPAQGWPAPAPIPPKLVSQPGPLALPCGAGRRRVADSPGSRLGPEAPSSKVRSTCLRAARVTSRGVCPGLSREICAHQPRTCPLRSGRGRGLHWPWSRQRWAVSSRPPRRCAPLNPPSRPRLRLGRPARAAGESYCRCSHPEKRAKPLPARPGWDSFPGGKRSEGCKGQLVPISLPPASPKRFF